MRRFALPGVLAAALMLTAAATAPSPTVVEKNGDLYLGGTRLTTYGRNFEPVVAPNGPWVAYLSFPAWVEGGGYLATNVWLLNLRTREARRLADQPLGASNEGPYVCRDLLTWSKDGRTVAWLEWRLASDSARFRPTYLVTRSAFGDARREVRVRLAPNTTGWSDDGIFPELLGVAYAARLEGDTFSLTVTRDRTDKTPALRVTVDVRTGLLREVR
ncbi:PD40 domain-containing protein [Deinococcus yavapaiensis]|uniref:WD40 repeat protein n=1 Tax=Deinococcus yavapaiensis KR-236 TaxID=694435 RepID=A0A318S9L0_9DEIO|nr:PD40 domain-containing protein [Deinococcus yavapaiensis]PYE55415.1 WD40 repeat protein [Deinococcus yavapaiensis KR-236]